MKLFVNARFLTQPISGVQRYAIECSRQIKSLYKDVVFLAPKNIIHKDVAQELDAKMIGLNTGQLWEQIDLPLHLLSKKGAPLLSLANTAPLMYNNNFICVHDLAFYHHPEWNTKAFSIWYNILIPRLVNNGKHIFTVSNTIKAELNKFYKVPESKISVTYNGIGTHLLISDEQQLQAKEKIILSVGTFNTRKNHPNLVKAFLQSESRKNHKLIIIGDKNRVFSETGIDEEILKSKNIEILQRLTDEELKAIYLKASVLVSLSDYEGFGIPLLEGAYFGCKILCSDIPVYRELFSGFATFTDQHDIDAIVRGLDALCANDNTFTLLNRNVLTARFSYEKSARMIISKIDPAALLPTE